MGNPFSIPCDPCVNNISQCLDEKVGYTHNLVKNLDDLETTMQVLKAKRDDLSRRLTRDEDRGLQRVAEFQVWLTRVETIENSVNGLLNARYVEVQKLCLSGFCSKSLLSSYRYGKSIFLTLREVEKLKSEVFKVIAARALTPEVEERPLQPTIVGQEIMLDKAWKYLMKDGVGTMGMYGMGGVGKTTLLSQINNKFSNNMYGFDFVIWIVVSKELHVETIQNEIAQKVGLGGEEWNKKDKTQKADRLFNFLKRKRFMLFLDDIWEKMYLDEIGVPDPRTQIGCKVAFTTRSLDVCSRMGVEDPMEVQCLADNKAFDLFQNKVGQLTLGSDPGIPDLARIVAKKCSGLPLALNVIGETMSCKRTVQEWRHAIHVLNSYAAEFSGMDDKILPLLKFSYDSLNGEEVKSCLLYCSLFPEDYKIPKERLIEYWIGEGIIDGSEGIEMAENKGYDILGSLICASLLMNGVNEDGKACVCMHDVVREMALWIASDLGKQKEAFIVRAGGRLTEIPKVKNWKVVRKMSLMHNKIVNLAGSPACLELTTLLLQHTKLKYISSVFFTSMAKLTVLDLSSNEISELPEGISNLVSLQYLNLSKTGIHHFPKCLQELRKLIQLDLEYTKALGSIGGISSLQNLKVLKLYDSGFTWDLNTMDELEALEHLEILTVRLPPDPEKFLSSHRLMSCTRSLEIERNNLKSSGISLPDTMDMLRKLRIGVNGYCSISEIKMARKCSFLSLSEVRIGNCKGLRELTFLMFSPNLRSLSVYASKELEDIINKEKACQVENSEMILPFPKLNCLELLYLRKLKNIYWSPLPFPCLETIRIGGCPNLKKLPLDSTSGKHGLIVKYEDKEWLEGVKWEDEATKTRFLPSCKQSRHLWAES